uniref:CRIB domain-containing protein n=1 Tax=Caenorhabditis tropicalis TaxID=1561998 RepID=A0A1I7TIT7_9PELO
MPNDLPLLPPKNQLKHLDKTMISPPTDFRHLAHVGPMGQTEIENLRKSDNVIDAVNEVNYYIKPSSSSNSTVRSQRKERLGLDDAFPISQPSPEKREDVREYQNHPSSHQYMNIAPPRPSTKNYRAPAPPTPPSRDTKPNLVFREEEPEVVDPPVVFRSISKEPTIIENLYSPTILTPKRIEAPKPNSVVIERPMDLGSFGFGLDDCIPIMKETSPLKTLSPLHRPLAIPRPQLETPILSPASPPKYQDGNYMSTVRSTSAQGKKILDELDDWLDDLDDDDREQLSTISTDESGYPTLAHEKDRVFMKHLVEKYELGVEPETIRLKRKKVQPQPFQSKLFLLQHFKRLHPFLHFPIVRLACLPIVLLHHMMHRVLMHLFTNQVDLSTEKL